MKHTKLKKIVGIFLCSAMLFVGCAKQEPKEELNSNETASTTISMAVLKGPTGVGSVPLMEQSKEGNSQNNYNVVIASAPEEVVAKVISKEVDVAMVPTNLAAVLYQKTKGDIQMAAVNTLGVLYLVEHGEEIQKLSDLSGKTVCMSGQGAVPEYVFQYLLEKNGVADVTIDFVNEHAEAAVALSSGKADVALLPEPFLTGALLSDEKAKVAMDLNQVWEETVEDENPLTMGCVIVQKSFLKENKEAFNAFLEEYQQSISFAQENVDKTAELTEQYGIIPKKEVALKAIPNCNLVYLDEDGMKESVTSFFNVLFEANPKSIGGKMPDDAFYYLK
jgi:NitT/TauT family transport system substrate-binding protein